MEEKYPESQKASQVREDADKLGMFMEWLMQRYAICSQDRDGNYFYSGVSIQRTLAEYFGIDYDAYQDELDQMIKELRDESE